MIVVSDAGPPNYLVLIGRIGILHALYGEIVLPTAVRDELLDAGAPPAVANWAGRLPEWVVLRDPSMLPDGGLGWGERAAMALAQELGAVLLCDDGPARAAARRAGLSVTGTLGVLQLAHARSLLEIEDALSDLGDTNFHRAEGLFEDVRRRAHALRDASNS